MRSVTAWTTGLLLLALASCAPPGQRLLDVEIEVEGQVVFEGFRGVRDTMEVERMWEVIGDIAFDPAAGTPLDSLEPVEVLEGMIVVRIRHTGDELATASLASVSLAMNPSTKTWSLDDASRQRLLQAASK
ncbi:MAG: hypothetical protein ACYTGR_07785 [Planctomycetota bacterium]|jgi:hypothetical protein